MMYRRITACLPALAAAAVLIQGCASAAVVPAAETSRAESAPVFGAEIDGEESSETETGQTGVPEAAGTSAAEEASEPGTEVPGTETPETEPPATEPEKDRSGERVISLMALGDDLLHTGIIETGRQADGTLDYTFLFEDISDFLAAADIRVINQETIFGGNERGLSAYPQFNSPTEAGDAIAAAGFNVVLHATNHASDMGVEGIDYCLRFWEKYPEITVVGMHAPASGETDGAERRIPLIEVSGVTFAILNYTYGVNDSKVSPELESRLEFLCGIDGESRYQLSSLNGQVLEDIRAAEELADAVIVFPHWGKEYQMEPTEAQRSFALQMTEAGADLIIGTHPHVLQPVEWVEAENGNRALCFYSIGNYVSTMDQGACMLEAIAWVTFRADESGVTVAEEESGAYPLVCHYTVDPIRLQKIYPLEEYSEELAAAHGIISRTGESFTLRELEEWCGQTLGGWRMEKSRLEQIWKKRAENGGENESAGH